MSVPKITIITVTFNSAKTLASSIESVLNQCYQNLEYIIIDGESTDGTLDVIKRYECHLTKWISEKDSGLYEAMNKGLDIASGEFVAFLNSDDVYINSPLSCVAAIFDEKPDTEVIYANAIVTSDTRPDFIYKSSSPIRRNDFWRTPIIHPSMFVKRSEFRRIGYFSLKYKIAADYDLILRLFLNKSSFTYQDAVWSSMRGGGLSENKWKQGWFEVYSILKTHQYLNGYIAARLIWAFFKAQCAEWIDNNRKLKHLANIFRKYRKKYRVASQLK